MSWEKYIPEDIAKLYEVHDFKHAAAILSEEFPAEFDDVCATLREFRFSKSDILTSGGNESQIPKIFSQIIRPKGWDEQNLDAELRVFSVQKGSWVIKNTFKHGSHKVDYIKGRVAFDLEWNSKDQTFDRDLYAFRSFFEYDAISLGILVTRSERLNPVFKELGIHAKYGASTTHMGKLLDRLHGGRNGGCPVLVFGITPDLMINNESR